MDYVQLLPYVIFAGIVVSVFAVASLFSSKVSRASERLDELRDPTLRNREAKDQKKGMGAMFEKAAPALSRALQPKTELEENKLKVRMANAGYISPSAPQLYLAVKVAIMLGGVMLGSRIWVCFLWADAKRFDRTGHRRRAGLLFAGDRAVVHD